jgi:hypothetical protein
MLIYDSALPVDDDPGRRPHPDHVRPLLAGKQHGPEPRRPGQGLQFRLSFEPAGYDINQRLIEYNNQDSTHGRAALVGILNTLLVAFVGCIPPRSSV